jgi:DNA-binding beta-propeller fold protein YncE
MPKTVYGEGKYTYELAQEWAKLPAGWSFVDACGLSVDAQDRVYVLTRSPHPIMVFDRDGNLLTSWGEGFFHHAHGSCVSPEGKVYSTDDSRHIVARFTPQGDLIQVLGTIDHPSDTGYSQQKGTPASLATIKRGGPPFNRPTGVGLSPSGEVYVSDGYGNARVHKFSPGGTLLQSWGEPGEGPGQFRLPHSVWIDDKERVWVTDRENNRIQIFNTSGKFLSQWTGLSRPTALDIDGDGTVFVSELNQRVSIFSNEGALLARWGGTEEDKDLFIAPHSIAVDSRGDLYVGEVSMTIGKVDRGANVVRKFIRKARKAAAK